MQLYYLLIVVVVGDVKIMSSTVTVIFAVINYSAITWVANNYNIRTEPRFFEPNWTTLILNWIRFFQKTKPKPNRNKKNLFCTSLVLTNVLQNTLHAEIVTLCGTWKQNPYTTPCLKKTAFLFLSELHQIYMNFNKFW